MKYLILIALLVCQVLAERGSSYDEQHKQCMEETHVTGDTLQTIEKDKDEDVDPKVKDFSLCIFKKVGWISSAGKLQRDEIKKYYVDSDLSQNGEYVDKCAVEKSSDLETAYKLAKCQLEARRKYTPSALN